MTAAALSPREIAGNRALAALAEAERRHLILSAPRRSRSPSRRAVVALKADLRRPVSQPEPPRDPVVTLDVARARRELTRLAAKDELAARVVAALPPLEWVASNVDIVAHVRGIVLIIREARARA